jgi:hypothetical protein
MAGIKSAVTEMLDVATKAALIICEQRPELGHVLLIQHAPTFAFEKEKSSGKRPDF